MYFVIKLFSYNYHYNYFTITNIALNFVFLWFDIF